MSEVRPDPDRLLERVRAEDSSHARGKLKIYFGAAPGVGKTYAMLQAARILAKAGVDLVVGYIEPHARPETQALVLGLDLLPRKLIEYRGLSIAEFDLESALARKPTILLLDELAHTNVPGVTHAKRWQDVETLLAAGINVWTTLNVQHIESLNDVVAQITGVTVRETVPDSVFDGAHEVELVDLPPDELAARLHEGKVYVPAQAQHAIHSFFRKGNLIALRELALRRTAERVHAQMYDYRRMHEIGHTWPTNERLLVCVGPSPHSARLVRAAKRTADRLRAPWLAVHIETPSSTRMAQKDRERLAENLQLAEELGAEVTTVAGSKLVDALIEFARERNVTRILVGKPRGNRLTELIRGSFVRDLIHECGEIDIHVTSGDDELPQPKTPRTSRRASWAMALAWAASAVLAATLLGFVIRGRDAPANAVMVYLLAVILVALRFGRRASLLASILGVLAFDIGFVPPYLTVAVSDTQYVVTFLVMLGTGFLVSELTSRVALQAEFAQKRERRTAALFHISHELASVRTREDTERAVVARLSEALDGHAVLLMPGPEGKLKRPGTAQEGGFDPSQRDTAVAQWAFDHAQPAGLGTATLPGSDAVYLPLLSAGEAIGVLGLRPKSPTKLIETDRLHLLEAFAAQASIAVKRIQLAEWSERVRVEMESERTRSALLSAVSHDLRTPLTAIAGAAGTLLEAGSAIDADSRRELLESILDESEALSRLVSKLLDATRLEAGAVVIKAQWQSLEEIIGSAVRRLKRALAKHTVKTRQSGEIPLVLGDGVLLEQVFINLLENAARHSPPGSPIEIGLSTQPETKAGAKVIRVSVMDRGRGIPESELEQVFGKFRRGMPASLDRRGVGLGLTICRGIVELHGGRVWAQNRMGGGAEIVIELPISEPPETAPDPSPVPAGDTSTADL
jgi:two-component system sensor histidine kinase KdpD